MNTDHWTDEQIAQMHATYRTRLMGVDEPSLVDAMRAALATLPEPPAGCAARKALDQPFGLQASIDAVIDVTDEDVERAIHAYNKHSGGTFVDDIRAALESYADRLRERTACWVPLPDGVTEIPAGVRMRRIHPADPSVTAIEWTAHIGSQHVHSALRYFVHRDDLPKLTPPDPRISVVQEWLNVEGGGNDDAGVRELLARLDALNTEAGQ